MLEVWPLVPVYHGVGLTLAVFSYDGRVHFGLNADRDLVPDLELLGRDLEQSAADLLAALHAVRTPDARKQAEARPTRRRRGREAAAGRQGAARAAGRPRG